MAHSIFLVVSVGPEAKGQMGDKARGVGTAKPQRRSREGKGGHDDGKDVNFGAHHGRSRPFSTSHCCATLTCLKF